MDGGTTLKDSVPLAEALAQKGIDAIEVSGGTAVSGTLNPARVRINHPSKEAYFLPEVREIRKVTSCPLIIVGGIRTTDRILEILDEGAADYFSISRPLIREPDLPNNWRTEIRSTSSCISCNQCFKTMVEGGLHCVQKKKLLET